MTTDGAALALENHLVTLWESIGEQPSYPVSTETVCRLFSAAEYRCTPEVIDQYLLYGYIESPDTDDGGDFAWELDDMAQLLIALETRRMWQPFSGRHDAKKTGPERGREYAERDGRMKEWFEGMDRCTVEDLLLSLWVAEQQDDRDKLYVALKVKLDSLGVV